MEINSVITGDLVKSRKIKDADMGYVIGSLKNTFNEINLHLLGGKGTFEIYRGDSFQGLIPNPESALLVAIIIRAHLRTYEPSQGDLSRNKAEKPLRAAYSDARIGIGIGSIRYNAERIAESHGEAYQKSGEAFDLITRENERLAIKTPWHETNSELAVESRLADALISRWTASTSEAMYHHLLYGKNQKELANDLKISQPAVHTRLAKYGNIYSIQAFLNRYHDLMIKAK